jgi:hypothetical protein
MRENAAAPDAPESGKATIFVTDTEDFLLRRSNGIVNVISAGYNQLSSSTSHATTSTSYVAINDMSTTLTAGTYVCWFSSSATFSGTSASGYISVFVNGSQETTSERVFHAHSINSSHSHTVIHNVALTHKFTLSQSGTVEIRFKVSTGTLTMLSRTAFCHRGDG